MYERGTVNCLPCEEGCDPVWSRATAAAKIAPSDEWMPVCDDCLVVLQTDHPRDCEYEPI